MLLWFLARLSGLKLTLPVDSGDASALQVLGHTLRPTRQARLHPPGFLLLLMMIFWILDLHLLLTLFVLLLLLLLWMWLITWLRLLLRWRTSLCWRRFQPLPQTLHKPPPGAQLHVPARGDVHADQQRPAGIPEPSRLDDPAVAQVQPAGLRLSGSSDTPDKGRRTRRTRADIQISTCIFV